MVLLTQNVIRVLTEWFFLVKLGTKTISCGQFTAAFVCLCVLFL